MATGYLWALDYQTGDHLPLDVARALARTGKHADAAATVESMRDTNPLEGAYPWTLDAQILKQLDALCAESRAQKPAVLRATR